MIKETIKAKGLTLEQAATLCNMSVAGLVKVMKQKSQSITVLTAIKIKQGLNLDPTEYITGLDAYKRLFKK